MGNLSFNITGNNSDFIQKTEEIRAAIQVTALESEKQSKQIELSFGNTLLAVATGKGQVQVSLEQIKKDYNVLNNEAQNTANANGGLADSFKKMFSAIGGQEAIKQFASEVIRVRGEFQQLELTFTTLLQSKEKANSLMGEIAKTAAQTPFSVPELAEGAKQLLSYGFEAEEVNDTLLRLGNVASGLGMPLDQLSGLYGSIASQGSLCANDLDQFAASGIPMMQGLADMFGVSTEKVNDMVAAGTVGFPEVQRVIENMTNEGGQFYNLMDEQSQTISGKINNLGDAWDMMLNKMGESGEGVIGGSIDLATYLIDNYEQIGKILLSLIEIYGVYRAACIANIVLTQSWGTTQIALGAIMSKLRTSFIALTASMNLNPLVLAATALVGLGILMWNFADRTDAATKAQQKFNNELDKLKQKEEERKQKAENLIRIIQDETETEYAKAKAYRELQDQSPALTEAFNREEIATLDLKAARKLLNEESDKMNYDYFVSKIKETTEALVKLKAEDGQVTGTVDGTPITIDNSKKIKQAEADLKKYKEFQKEYERIKKEEEENNLPIGSRIDTANQVLNQIKKEFDKVNQYIQSEKEKNPYYVIPLHLQLEFEGLSEQMDKAQAKVAALEKQKPKNTTYRQDMAAAKSDWLKASVEYQKTLNDKGSSSEAVKKAKDDLDAKKQTYEGLGGVTDNRYAEQAENIRNQQKRLNDLIENQAHERQRLEEDLNNQNIQAEIDAMDEGADKTMAQMLFNHKREIGELNREKEDFLSEKIKIAEEKFNATEELENAKNPKRAKKTFDSKGIQLSETEKQVFDNRESNVNKKQGNELKAYANTQKQAMNEYLKEYGTSQEKRLAVTELYNDKIEKATTEGEKLTLGKEMTKALSDLDIEANKATASFSKLFSDMSKSSVKDMRAISSEAKSALEYVKGGKFETGSDGKGKYGISKETFNHYQDSPEEVKQMEKGIEDLNAEADKCETGFNKMGIGFKNFFNAGSDPKKVREALSEIEAGMGEVMQAGQFLSNTFASLGDSLGSDTLGQVAEGMNVAMDAAGAAMSGAQAGAMFGPWGAAAGAAIGLVSSLGSSLAKLHDAKKEKNIQRIQEQIEVLEKSYEKLGESIDKSYSSDASKLIEQQNTLLEQQKVLIQNQIAEEKGKKKADNGRIKDWENQIEEINKAIAEGKEKAIDVLLGEDVKSAIDNFAQAYVRPVGSRRWSCYRTRFFIRFIACQTP